MGRVGDERPLLRRAAVTRSSIALRVVASALTSSLVGGTGSRSVSEELLVDAGRHRGAGASTGASAAPMTRQAMTPMTTSRIGSEIHSSSVRTVAALRSMSVVGAAATTSSGALAGRARRHRRDLQTARET